MTCAPSIVPDHPALPSRALTLAALRAQLPDPVEYFRTRKLITKANAKFEKADDDGSAYTQVGVTMSPAWESGVNMCAFASNGCAMSCLKTTARQTWPAALQARILRTHLFMFHRDVYLEYVERDLASERKAAHKRGERLVVRADTLSDTNVEIIYRNLMLECDQWMDYTKNPHRYAKFLAGKMPANYHLTFSRSETNERQAFDFVRDGGTATLVVRDARALEYFVTHGYAGLPCVTGELNDRRWEDPKGHWVLLVAKGKAKTERTGFVVDAPVAA